MVAAEEGAEPAEAELEEPALFVCEGADDCCDDEAPKSLMLALTCLGGTPQMLIPCPPFCRRKRRPPFCISDGGQGHAAAKEM